MGPRELAEWSLHPDVCSTEPHRRLATYLLAALDVVDACERQSGKDLTGRGGGISREVRAAIARLRETAAGR